MKLRAILDTNILVAGLASQLGASFALIQHALAERFVMVVSPALWLEYEAVLKRVGIQALHHLSDQDVETSTTRWRASLFRFSRIFCGGPSYATRMTKWCWRQQSTGRRLIW